MGRTHRYRPKHIEENRVGVLHELIEAQPLAALVTLGADGLCATHVRFELDPELGPFGTLRGHVARANPVWREFAPEVGALAIFQVAGADVPAERLAKQRTLGLAVPAGYHTIVHARGPLRVIDDRERLGGLVVKLADRQEARSREPRREAAPPTSYVERATDAIVGLELRITRLAGQWRALPRVQTV